ncbi:hypothetical protein Tco_0243613, partial [Tanacetum coccineum]
DPYKVSVARWKSRVAVRSSSPIRQILLAQPRLPCRPAVLVLPRQPILVGRPYRTQPNGITLHQILIQILHLILLRDIPHEVSSEDGYVPFVPREVSLGVYVEDSYEPYTEPDVDFDIQADIDACIPFADDLRARGT